jgi:hypothetical protein
MLAHHSPKCCVGRYIAPNIKRFNRKFPHHSDQFPILRVSNSTQKIQFTEHVKQIKSESHFWFGGDIAPPNRNNTKAQRHLHPKIYFVNSSSQRNGKFSVWAHKENYNNCESRGNDTAERARAQHPENRNKAE